MIAVKRCPPPRVLDKNKASWLSDLRTARKEYSEAISLSSVSKSQKTALESKIDNCTRKYQHQEVKRQLLEMFHGKCAYCESKITTVSYGHIEHFYPKAHSDYWERVFDWDNLVLSCEKCNGAECKGSRFPLDSTGQPLLIDPTDPYDDPSQHITFCWDGEYRRAYLKALDERGQTTIDVFDLNGTKGRKELLIERSERMRHLLCVALYAKQGDAEAIAILQEAIQDEYPYLAFARHIMDYVDSTVSDEG